MAAEIYTKQLSQLALLHNSYAKYRYTCYKLPENCQNHLGSAVALDQFDHRDAWQ